MVKIPYNNTVAQSVATNGIENNPATVRDAHISVGMLGKSKFVAQGKTTRTKPGAEKVAL